jgi:flagellin
MAFSIVTNVASLLAQDNLRITSNLQQTTIQRLTSGLRINSSADDAAGLAIANGFRSDVSVLQQGIRNANDGLSTLQTIDGGINNISLLLDRARTLATQSASGTFTGDRNVLNSEFSSVLSEIDRQAQAIGLDPGGAFAKALAVFIGGGRGHSNDPTSAAINNGSIAIDLTHSTVGTKSLGLTGLQVLGGTAGTTDIGAASATSVANILANTTNTGSEAASGFTDFYFSGPGFGDSSRIRVSVNLTGVTDATTLASAINNAIQAAGNGNTAAATAFKNANITAVVNTDSTGKQQLAFNSGTTGFQVQAGDRLANALLGNYTSASDPTGLALSTTVQGSANVAAGPANGAETVDVRFQGAGLSSPVDLTLNIANGATIGGILTSLSSAVAANSSLKAAGITVTQATSGSPLVFTSTLGQKFSVNAGGDTQNLLGLGTFLLGAANAYDYSSITAPATYAASAANSGADTLEFSINGAASAVTSGAITGTSIGAGTVNTGALGTLQLTIDGTAVNVNFANDPNVGAAESLANIQKYINSTARGALGLGANVNVASLNGQTFTITSPTTGANSSVAIVDNATAQALHLTSGAGNVTNSGSGTTGVTINLAGGTATAGTVSSASAFATADTSAHLTLNFSVDGTAIAADFTNDINSGATESIANIALFLNSQAQKALGTSATIVSVVNSKLVITSPTTGLSSNVTVTDGGAPTSYSRTFNLTAGTNVSSTGAAPTGADIVNRLNQAFGSSSVLAAAGLQASFATGSFTIASTNGTFFQLSTRGTSAGSDLGFGVTGAAFTGNNTVLGPPAASPFFDAGGSNQTAAFAFTPISRGNDSQTITVSAVDPNGAQQSLAVVLQNNGVARNARTIDEAIHTINSALQQSNNPTLQSVVAVKEDAAGTEKIRFLSGSAAFSVNIGTNADGSGVGSQGTSNASTVSAGGSTAEVSTQSSAQAAVSLLSSAVTRLGAAQAVVGRGQNQLQYAINLASTQANNLSIAQGRIRDADLAAEAANLTRSSIALQSGIAALAQANSAPQAVLALLRG